MNPAAAILRLFPLHAQIPVATGAVETARPEFANELRDASEGESQELANGNSAKSSQAATEKPGADLLARLALAFAPQVRTLATASPQGLTGRPLRSGAKRKEKNGDDVAAPVVVPAFGTPPATLSLSLPTGAGATEPQARADKAAPRSTGDFAPPESPTVKEDEDRPAPATAAGERPAMAVAVRVAPKATAATSPAPQPVAAPSLRPRETSEAAPVSPGTARPFATPFWNASVTLAGTSSTIDQPETSQPKPVAEATPAQVAPELPRTSEPLKQLSIEIRQPNQESVEVRLVDRAGELHVAVHATDSELAHAMREQLPELANRLEHAGNRVDAWRPGGLVTPASATAESQPGAKSFQHPDWQSQQHGSQPDREQRGSERQDIPRWVEELQGSITREHAGEGEVDGISN